MKKPVIWVAVAKFANQQEEKERSYAKALIEGGAEVRFIDVETNINDEAGDGLLIMGGPDLPPEMYGQENIGCEELISRERLNVLDNVFTKMFNEKKPMLGICMGMQYLNVKFGGTLIQDMKEKSHRNEKQDVETEIKIFNEGKLREIIGKEKVYGKCHHHQCVDEEGWGLKVTAESSDGCTEALEHESYPFLVGVQWHPERTPTASGISDDSIKLFRAFVDACRV